MRNGPRDWQLGQLPRDSFFMSLKLLIKNYCLS